MGSELTITIAVFLTIGIYILIHLVIVKRATKSAHKQALLQTENAMQAVLQRMVDRHVVDDPTVVFLQNVSIDSWGRGVMVFEFIVRIPISNVKQLHIFHQRLNKMLNDYAGDHDIPANNSTGKDTFLVTDIWKLGDLVHLSVAYLVNEATIEYLKDLHKIDYRK